MRWSLRKALGYPLEVAAPVPEPETMQISKLAVDEARGSGRKPITPWTIPEPAPGVMPKGKLAMDWGNQSAGMYAWAMNGAFSEGVAFLGYPYLSELAQRPEYRQIVKKYADHMTRKWVRMVGGSDTYRKRLEKAMIRYRVRDVFREVIEHDGFFGRGQIFVDVGKRTDGEIATPLTLTRNKLYRRLEGLRTVEPVWSYPGPYESTDPLHPDFYKPREWYVSGRTVNATRLVTVIGREMPDILKPAYAFGGLSRTQMAKPYVENWIRTRQSVSDIIHSFTVWVLKTNMKSLFSGIKASIGSLLDRLGIFNELRDNQGVFAIDKDTEEFANVSASLASLDKLQAQAQEQMASVAAIPLIELLGISPSGLNATSDGEIRTFYANIKTDQERMLRDPLTYILRIIQLSEFGSIKEDVTFEFEDLWERSTLEKAQEDKARADIDAIYVDRGIVSTEEAREKIGNDEDSPYHGIDLSGPPPEPEEDESNDNDSDSSGAVK